MSGLGVLLRFVARRAGAERGWLADWSLRRGWLRLMRGLAWHFVLLLFFEVDLWKILML